MLFCALAVTYTLGPSLYYIGLKHTDLSVTTVLDASGAVYSFVLGILFLKEGFDSTKLLGVALIIIAIIIVSGKVRAFKRFNFYESILLISPIFYATGAVLDNILLKSGNTLTYLSLSFLTAGTVMTLVNIPRLYKSGDKSIKNKMFIKTVFINAFFVFMYGFATFKAYQLGGEVSKMYPIAQSESVIVPFLAIFLLGEKDNFKYKVVASIVAFVGILLLR
jgi:drug/metabolite transporter (DMT)-like permease